MSPGRALAVYLTIVFAGAAALAPFLYFAIQYLSGSLPFLKDLAEAPFHRYLNRCLLGLALLGIYPLLRVMGMASVRSLGLRGPVWFGIWRGFALGFTTLGIVALLALLFGARVINPKLSVGEFAARFTQAVLTGITVSILEEILFRGALLGALQKATSTVSALLVSSMIYAAAHFLQHSSPPETVTPLSGFLLIGQMLSGFFHVDLLIPRFPILFLAGCCLGLIYLRAGNLYSAIGLHAGWIVWLKLYGYLLIGLPEANRTFWGTGKLLDGWMAFLVMATVLGILVFWMRRRTDFIDGEVAPKREMLA